MQVDDPIHEVEAGEANWKDDSRIFVDGGRRSAEHFVEILALNDQSQIQVVHDCRCHLNRHSSARSVVLALKDTSRNISYRPSTMFEEKKWIIFASLNNLK